MGCTATPLLTHSGSVQEAREDGGDDLPDIVDEKEENIVAGEQVPKKRRVTGSVVNARWGRCTDKKCRFPTDALHLCCHMARFCGKPVTQEMDAEEVEDCC